MKSWRREERGEYRIEPIGHHTEEARTERDRDEIMNRLQRLHNLRAEKQVIPRQGERTRRGRGAHGTTPPREIKTRRILSRHSLEPYLCQQKIGGDPHRLGSLRFGRLLIAMSDSEGKARAETRANLNQSQGASIQAKHHHGQNDCKESQGRYSATHSTGDLP